MTVSFDIAAGALILALAAYLWHVTTTFDSDPLGLEQGMPATLMPRLVLGVIAGRLLDMFKKQFGTSIAGIDLKSRIATKN